MRLPPDFWARPFAHRGLHGAGRPENGLSAIEAAVEADYGVEFDVQFSADDVPVVFHDYTLERLTDAEGRVDALDAAALGRIALTGSEETIPTLAAVLGAIGGRAPVLLEIKDQSGAFGETDGRPEAAVCGVVEASGHLETVAIMSFNPYSVGHVQQRLPDAFRGLVSYDFEHPHDAHVDAKTRHSLANLESFDRFGCDFVSYGAASLPTPTTKALRTRGVPIFCWTIRSEQQAEVALKHCDQITFEGYIPA